MALFGRIVCCMSDIDNLGRYWGSRPITAPIVTSILNADTSSRIRCRQDNNCSLPKDNRTCRFIAVTWNRQNSFMKEKGWKLWNRASCRSDSYDLYTALRLRNQPCWSLEFARFTSGETQEAKEKSRRKKMRIKQPGRSSCRSRSLKCLHKIGTAWFLSSSSSFSLPFPSFTFSTNYRTVPLTQTQWPLNPKTFYDVVVTESLKLYQKRQIKEFLRSFEFTSRKNRESKG